MKIYVFEVEPDKQEVFEGLMTDGSAMRTASFDSESYDSKKGYKAAAELFNANPAMTTAERIEEDYAEPMIEEPLVAEEEVVIAPEEEELKKRSKKVAERL